MKIDQKVSITASGENMAMLREFFPDVKQKQVVEISPEYLKRNSHILEKRICDNPDCGKIFERSHRALEDTFECYGEDVCLDCLKLEKYKKIRQEHMKATVQQKYGVDWASQSQEFQDRVKETNLKKFGTKAPAQNQEVQEKIKKTFLEKYGTETPLQLDVIKNKIIQTNIKKYGVEHPLQNKEVHDKVKQTCLERYGVENVSQSKEIQEKRKQTFLERYGVENIMDCPEFVEKIMNSRYKNNNVPDSKQQKEVYDMVKKMYPDIQIEYNYPYSRLALDIVMFFPNNAKINIEYDGGYWHKNRQGKDRARDEILKKEGFKILRIKSNELLPSEDELKKKIEEILVSNHKYFELILEDWNK